VSNLWTSHFNTLWFIYMCYSLNPMGSRANFGDDDKFGGLWLQPTRYGGIRFIMVDWGLALANPAFFLKYSVAGRICAFSCCHVASHEWATWWPFIGPCHHTEQRCHVTSATLACHATCRVVVRSAMWLYELPCGTFPLVHGLTEKVQK
jgi:hypothetical protein